MFGLLMKTLQANKVLPQISDTERQALEAGTVWIDGDLFSGNPDFTKMLTEPYSELSKEEMDYINGPVQQLCDMADSHQIAQTRIIPESVIQFMKDNGFFSLLIPKEHGGKDFSTLAISTVMMKVSAFSPIRLANGTYMPCFALTEPTAGSDAASILARCRVFKAEDGSVKLSLNFSKRYITLAPIANIISVAFKLEDPENLLGKGTHPGITVALLHRGTPGLTMGMHHQPIGEAFYNGPIVGENVVVDASAIIGGTANAGMGWKMLMEQLAGGRAVSLPAGAVAGIKGAAASAGAYAKVRQQFGMSIASMEGVQEKLAHIAGMSYLAEATRVFGCSSIDNGQQPPVVSAIMKAYMTEMAREIAIDALDVMAGAGVMQGPSNIIGRAYTCAPVGVTVEGANIMTRTLIVFGQGAIRCHPYALKVVHAIEQNNVPEFRKALLGWIGHVATNTVRTLVRGVTRGWSAGAPVGGATAKYYRRLAWASSRYAWLTDMALFGIGGKLKARGQITGRYADALAWQLMAISTLRRFEAEGSRQEDLPLVQYAVEYALTQVQKAFEGIYANFGKGLLGGVLRTVGALALRLNPVGTTPGDQLAQPCAQAILTLNDQYTRLSEFTPIPKAAATLAETQPGTSRLMFAFGQILKAESVINKIAAARRDAKYKGKIARGPWQQQVQDALQLGVISNAEADQIRVAEEARLAAIQVDTFTPQAFFNNDSVNGVPGFTNDVPPGRFDKPVTDNVVPLARVA